jgi:hypothetical protein
VLNIQEVLSMKRWGLMLVAIVSLVAAGAVAEERNAAMSVVLLPGAITGIGSYGPLGFRRLCSPLSLGLNEWHVGFIERLIKPNEAQRELLNKLLAASLDAKKAIASSCLEESIASGTMHLAVMEKRVSGLLGALKAIREPYETFYAALDKHQKALVDALGPTRRGWRW